MKSEYLCGFSSWHPKSLQKFANTKYFMAVYGLLGTVQAMSYMYFIVTLTTIEKRFKIPSQTTGIILSGNEISQILLSLILSYAGGQRNRPLWIAWGMIICAMSCFILALPHFIFGAGEDMMQLTEEYMRNFNETVTNNSTDLKMTSKKYALQGNHHLCLDDDVRNDCDESLITIMPLVLIFLSQFVLGVGNTLYYALGQTYLDDNTKKTNTPLMLAFAMSLRMVGPIIGFFLGFASLNMFIDPSKTPLIDKNDPRWLGAWWFGWIILGSTMLLFSGLIGLFPKKLPPKMSANKFHPTADTVKSSKSLTLKEEEEEETPLNEKIHSNLNETDGTSTMITASNNAVNFPQLKDFPKALMRLLRNKLLIFNITAAIFYILGAAGYMTFLTKYMEVQFHKSAQTGTIIIGPATIIGMVLGLLASGSIISKWKPTPNKVLFWNVIVGGIYILGEFSYLFLYCGDTDSMLRDGRLNLVSNCNVNCTCDNVPYSPVCHLESKTTFFSPCHAGCRTWSAEEKVYSECTCLKDSWRISENIYASIKETEGIKNFDVEKSNIITTTNENATHHIRVKRDIHIEDDLGSIIPGACLEGCAFSFYGFALVSLIINLFGSSGRIGNILVNYRTVTTEDKSFAQGLALMMISLFALIPGPIIFGWIIDTTCLVWTQQCGTRGHCQLYNQKNFRFYVNSAAISLTSIGVIFDILVWYYGRNLDLYGEREQEYLEQIKRKNHVISPISSSKK